MYSVIATGGKQYLVKSGDVLKIEKLPLNEGDKVVFDKVLLTANDDGTGVKVGKPYVEGATVEATLEKQGKMKIWLSTTNHFEEGGEDQYQLIGTADLTQEHLIIKDIPASSFYKIVLESPHNTLNRWIVK